MKVKRLVMILASVLLVALLAVAGLRLAFPLPDISGRAQSSAIAADPSSLFGGRFAARAETDPGLTGVYPLTDGREALGSRLFLVERAEISIDAQYYIWQDDVSGRLLLRALAEAAGRGVRVRLLLDDNGIAGLDGILAAMNALPNFEIRLFNPSTIRSPKLLGYTFSFFRMNRRMHNKALIVDGAAAIVGGRNIGDAYFQLGEGSAYVDADVLGIGAVVPDTQAAFDAYWNSQSAYEIERIVVGTGDLDAFLASAARSAATEAGAAFRAAAVATEERILQDGADTLEWTEAQLLVDDPAKGLGEAGRDGMVFSHIQKAIDEGDGRVDLVSAYFVPAPEGRDYLAGLAGEGRAVSVQTNALNTTDVLMVHAGYTKHRRALLEAGVRLLELKPMSGADPRTIAVGPLGSVGGSSASLHAKTFAIGGEKVFIGSFNFDPRSVRLNCEMGFLIDSPTLAARLHGFFDTDLPQTSYRPEVSATGRIVWREILEDGSEVVHKHEPGATLFQRLAIIVIGVLPVEWLL